MKESFIRMWPWARVMFQAKGGEDNLGSSQRVEVSIQLTIDEYRADKSPSIYSIVDFPR